ncbi:MAG: hypothetical protein JSR47_10860 [Proteobacteria bacterium]|nr:hypothetical protein [Pseudomonadota bacterium]
MASAPRKYSARILRPIPYDAPAGPGAEGATRQVAPVGSYDVAETGEHLQFFSEDGDPFQMRRSHALEHKRAGHLHIEDWES